MKSRYNIHEIIYITLQVELFEQKFKQASSTLFMDTISQCLPVVPVGHAHLYAPGSASEQEPLFLHGAESHWFMCV
jgi:hypothetical protein